METVLKYLILKNSVYFLMSCQSNYHICVVLIDPCQYSDFTRLGALKNSKHSEISGVCKRTQQSVECDAAT